MSKAALNEHLVLLGDSTLDNVRYLNPAEGEFCVEKQLHEIAAQRDWEVTVLAQDGSTLSDVQANQLPALPDSTTHIVLSVSGNDLLALLNTMVDAGFSSNSVYTSLGAGMSKVMAEYRCMLQELKTRSCHVAICTVYRPQFNHFFFKAFAGICLSLHNSRLLKVAEDLECSVIDLAALCHEEKDFANPLELNTRGGAKLVWNIAAFLADTPCPRRTVTVFKDLTSEEEEGSAEKAAFSGSRHTEVLIFGQDPSSNAHCCTSHFQKLKVYRHSNFLDPLPGVERIETSTSAGSKPT
eukprot:CAMPEP_0178426728 /NCGR_PEP_ID=MMETSP0689_2-20121128/29382_1 /TAXON_ID=160604 /ORGANISM="Amphidinium massartii, Strain CS-259" /LENGTH=295 /DNA_ID=CAMNT_0020048419 /DNA_START=105 /DNA_END=989 /DNA_ORIENTATION=-